MQHAGAVMFGPAIDAPPGRVDLIPSRITGRILRYFTPEPLSELLRRCESPEHAGPSSSADEAWLSLPFLRLATLRSGRVDPIAAEAMLSHILEGMGAPASAPAFQAPHALRTHLVFTGGPVASEAHVFADPAAIPPQLDDLACVVTETVRTARPAFVACIGFHAMHLHPFQDGNGRWVRRLVVQAGAEARASFSGLAHAVLLNQAKAQLTERHWPRAREQGLRDYLLRCVGFDSAMRGIAARHEFVLSALCVRLSRFLRSSRAYRELLLRLSLGDDVTVDALRGAGGVSRRVAEAWMEEIVALDPACFAGTNAFSLTPLLDDAECAARAVIVEHFGEARA